MLARRRPIGRGSAHWLVTFAVAAGTAALVTAEMPLGQSNRALAGQSDGKLNLVKNPGFAEGFDGLVIAPDGAGPAGKAEVDRSVFRGPDKASLKIPAETGRRILVRQAPISRDPKVKRFRFSTWITCKALPVGWIIKLGVEQWKGNTYVRTLQNRHIDFDRDLEWTPISLEFEVPEDVQDLAVYVGLWFGDDLKETPPPGGGVVWFDDVSLRPVPSEQQGVRPAAPTQPISVDVFYPLGERGLFGPGQPIQLVLAGTSNLAKRAEVEMETKITDFSDAPVGGKPATFSVEPGRAFSHALDLAPPANCGFYCVRTTLKQAGTTHATAATSFCVVPPAQQHDPFFGIDPNGLHDDMLRAFRRIGVGSLGIYQSWAVPKEALGDLPRYMRRQMETRWKEVWKSDFQLVGYVKTDPEFHPQWLRAEIGRRREQGIFPYPDALFDTLAGAVQAEAEVMKDRVRNWIVCEEYDAWAANPKAPAGSGTCELARYVLMSRIAYQQLKRVDPNFLVGGLTACMDYRGDPPYQLTRRVIPDLKPYFDLIAVHPYGGPYNLGSDSVLGPERQGLRTILLDTQRLQRECGKTPALMIGEKGLGVPYHLAPDDRLEKKLANFQARNLILAKSVSPMMYYSLHVGISYGLAWRMREQGLVSDDESPVHDFGLWKQMLDANGASRYRPRAAVAAYATVARLLAGATDAVEANVRPRFYGYVFKKGSGSVAALWTTEVEPYRVSVNVSQAAESCDLMGNARPLAAGQAELTISQSPVFLVSSSAPASLVKAIQQAAFPAR